MTRAMFAASCSGAPAGLRPGEVPWGSTDQPTALPAAASQAIYVTGCMRSGTTLVQRLLCAAPGAGPLVAECQYLTALLALYARWNAQFDQFLVDYFPSPQAFEAVSRQGVDAVLAAAAARADSSTSALVLKNPELAAHVPLLARWYPAARFVLVVRDPLDTIASMREVALRHRESGVQSHLAAAHDDMARLSAYYRSYYVPALRARAELGTRLFVVRYEDLVAGPAVLERLAEFTGLRLDETTLGSPSEAERTHWRDRRDDAYVSGFRSPLWTAALSAGEVGRHVERLTALEIAEIRRHCAGIARVFRYWQRG